MVALLAVAAAVVAMFSTGVQLRLLDVWNSLHLLGQAQPEAATTAIGTRIGLWQLAVAAFETHPFAGVGPDGFADAVRHARAREELGAWTIGLTHAHSDVLHAMATLGLPGLAAILAMYTVPAAWFAEKLRLPIPLAQKGAACGLALCVAFAVFGLSEAMLIIALTNSFYSVMMASCFVAVCLGMRLQDVDPRGLPSAKR